MQQSFPHIVSVGIARPTTSPLTPRVSSPVDSSKSAVVETSGHTDVLDNLSAARSSSNLATVFTTPHTPHQPTDLVDDEDADINKD